MTGSKQTEPTLHKTPRTEITPLFGNAKPVLEEMAKANFPFGGLASFISFLGQIGFARQVQADLPFAPNNAIPLAHLPDRVPDGRRRWRESLRPLGMVARRPRAPCHAGPAALSQR